MRVWPLALGVGAAAGAVAVMMLPRQCTVRKMAYEAAEKVEDAMTTAHRTLSGRRLSDGFNALCQCGHLELSLEALAVDKRFTGLFTDEEANEALTRLLEAGYRF